MVSYIATIFCLISLLNQFAFSQITTCPVPEVITTTPSQTTGEWVAMKMLKLKDDKDDKFFVPSDCLALNTSLLGNDEMNMMLHIIPLNSSIDLVNRLSLGVFQIHTVTEGRYKIDVSSQLTGGRAVSDSDEEENPVFVLPNVYAYIFSVDPDKSLVLFSCTEKETEKYVDFAIIFSRRSSDSLPSMSIEEINKIEQNILQKTSTTVYQTVSYANECFNKDRIYF